MKTSIFLCAAAIANGAFAFNPQAPLQRSGASVKPEIDSKDLSALGASTYGNSNAKRFSFPSFVRGTFSPKKNEVVVDGDFKLANIFYIAGVFALLLNLDESCYNTSVSQMCPPSNIGIFGAFLHFWFGAFLADRASRIKCIFDDKEFRMMDIYDEDMKKQMVPTQREKNYVVGGANRWKYSSIVNYDFFPNIDLPILVYFKETQTTKRKWRVGPSKWNKYYDKTNTDPGMSHFFPAFANAYQLREQFEKHGCRKPTK